jgi:hypothetical protein
MPWSLVLLEIRHFLNCLKRMAGGTMAEGLEFETRQGREFYLHVIYAVSGASYPMGTGVFPPELKRLGHKQSTHIQLQPRTRGFIHTFHHISSRCTVRLVNERVTNFYVLLKNFPNILCNTVIHSSYSGLENPD